MKALPAGGLLRAVAAFAVLALAVVPQAARAQQVTTTMTSSLNPSLYGQSVTFRAKVLAATGAPVPAGSVSFTDVTRNTSLGSGTLGGSPYAVAVGGGSCAVDGAGVLTCWPTASSITSGATAVSVSDTHKCAIVNGAVVCWGWNANGSLGDGTTTDADSNSPVTAIASGATAVAAATYRTCAIVGGAVLCWGANDVGQLGDGTTTTPRLTPTLTAITSGATAIAASQGHTCAIVTGAVWCWGFNSDGQLGVGVPDFDPHPTPVKVINSGATAIGAGMSHTCAIVNSQVRCWGDNQYGQLGDNTTNDSTTPVTTIAGGVTALSVGDLHNCAIMTGRVYCWGYNANGQLGDVTTTTRLSPTYVPAISDNTATMIAAGYSHTCAIISSTVECWGYNGGGVLGDGTTIQRRSPVPVLNMAYAYATLTTSTLAAGLHAVSAHYDDGVSTSDPQVNQEVDQAPAITSADAAAFPINSAASFTVTTSGYPLATLGASGALPSGVTFTDNGDGTATIAGTPALGSVVGSYPLTITAANAFTPDASQSFTLSVGKGNQIINFTSSAPSSPLVGTTYTPTATATSGLAVAFSAYGACSLTGGVLSFIAAGSCAIIADQAGNGNYNPAPLTAQAFGIGKGATTMTASATPATVKPGQSVMMKATLAVTAPATGTPTGSVAFNQGARLIGTGTIAAGRAQASVSGLKIGSHVITARYSGDSSFETSSVSSTVQVKAGLGNEEKANTFTTGSQQFPAIAKTRNGYAIVWASNGQDGNKFGVYGQRYNNNGVKVGSELHLSNATAGNQTVPKVAGLTGGRFVAVWQSDAQDGNGTGIYGRSVSAAGAPGAEFKVNTTTRGAQIQPVIAALPDGGFVVAWTSNGQDGSGLGVYAQRFDSKAKPLGAEFKVNTTTAGAQSAPVIAVLEDGGFVVVWQGPDANGLGIFGQRYDKAGKAVGKQFAVNKVTAGNQSLPSAAGLSDGNFIVTWQSDNQDGSGLGVFARRFTVRGAAVGNDIRVNTMTANDQSRPSVSAFTDQGFVVLWSSSGQDGSGQGVYAQAFTNTGAKVDVEFLINTATNDDQWQPAVAAAAAGNFMAAWTSRNQDGSLEGVYAQRFAVPSGE